MPTKTRVRTSDRALSLVTANPGITIPQLAAKLGIKENYLYRVLPRMEQEKRIEKRGRGWHPRGEHAPKSTVLKVITGTPRVTVKEMAARLETDPYKLQEALGELLAEHVITKQGDGYVLTPPGSKIYSFEAWETLAERTTRVFEVRAESQDDAVELIGEWLDAKDKKKRPSEVKLVNESFEGFGEDSGIDEILQTVDG
jgi:DNA-binding IscR family transcriptional regulator